MNTVICFLSAQTNKSSQSDESSRLAISVTPYSLASYDIAQLSDTTTAKMSYLHNYWQQPINPFSSNAQVFRVYLPVRDYIVLTVKDSKGNIIGEPYVKYTAPGYYSVKVDNYYFHQTGIFILTAMCCDSTFTRNMIFIK